MPAPADNGISRAHSLRDEIDEITEAMVELGALLSQRTQFLQALREEQESELRRAWGHLRDIEQLETMPV